MQLLYPLGVLLALLYRGLSIPVFGAFFAFLPVWEYLGGRIQEHRAGGRGAGST